MPTPADILSEEDDEDPDDQLRMQLEQGQGNTLAGGPQPPGQGGMPGGPAGPPPQAAPPPGGPSPNVPGPLAALAPKPHIKLKSQPPAGPKPHIKLKSAPPRKVKPKIRLKSKPGPSSALQNFLNAIATNPGS